LKFFKNIFVFLLVCVLVWFVIVKAYTPVMQLMYPIKYSNFVDRYAKEYGVDKFLVYAIIKNESAFNQNAKSNKGAKGLMQLMDETAQWSANKLGLSFNKDDSFDPKTNIQIGTYYLSYLLDVFGGDEKLAIAAYNGGIGNVKSWLSDKRYSEDKKTLSYIPYKETRNYVKKVLDSYNSYKELYVVKDKSEEGKSIWKKEKWLWSKSWLSQE